MPSSGLNVKPECTADTLLVFHNTLYARLDVRNLLGRRQEHRIDTVRCLVRSIGNSVHGALTASTSRMAWGTSPPCDERGKDVLGVAHLKNILGIPGNS